MLDVIANAAVPVLVIVGLAVILSGILMQGRQ